jgi:hypothetical protein
MVRRESGFVHLCSLLSLVYDFQPHDYLMIKQGCRISIYPMRIPGTKMEKGKECIC